jgi:hypothetical protein
MRLVTKISSPVSSLKCLGGQSRAAHTPLISPWRLVHAPFRGCASVTAQSRLSRDADLNRGPRDSQAPWRASLCKSVPLSRRAAELEGVSSSSLLSGTGRPDSAYRGLASGPDAAPPQSKYPQDPDGAHQDRAEYRDGRQHTHERGWTARLTVDDEVVIYCPECDEREFGEPADRCTRQSSRSPGPFRRDTDSAFLPASRRTHRRCLRRPLGLALRLPLASSRRGRPAGGRLRTPEAFRH